MPIDRLYSLLLAASLSALILACGPPPEQGAADSPDGSLTPEGPTNTAELPRETGGLLIWHVDAEPALLNPHLSLIDGTGQFIVSGSIFETMLSADNETLDIIPGVAERWEASDDHLTYTFYLRKDATFSDGKPLTAHDVVTTWGLIQNPENDTAPIRSYLSDVETFVALDDHTVQITVSKPYFGHQRMLGGLEILPAHIYGKGDFNKHPNNRAPIGSGPYVFDRWDSNQRIVLKRNPDYWKQEDVPDIDSIEYKIVKDPNSALQVMIRKEIDTMEFNGEMWINQAAKPSFEAEFNKYVTDSPIPGYLSRYNYVGWNTRKPQFADKRVRKALCMLFDRQLIIDTVWGGLGTVISGPMAHNSRNYNHDVKPLPFDPEGAAKLLDEAGWIDTDKDGIRDKDGVPFRFEILYANVVPEYDQLGTVYQEELARVGIKLDLGPLEWSTMQERIHNRSFDACMLAWLNGTISDPYQLWHSSQAEAGSNYPGLKNNEVDTLIEDARQEFDEAKREAMYQRVHEIIHDEQPYIFLYARPGLTAVDKRVAGISVYPPGLDPSEWFIPKANQTRAQ